MTTAVIDLRKQSKWTGERVARLGYLVGLGWNAEKIAGDPLIKATVNNTYRQAQRFGLSFRAAVKASPIGLPESTFAPFEVAATKRGMGRETLMRLLLTTIASEPTLIDNILDDGR